MTLERLYSIFDQEFENRVLPYIESKLERSFLTEPLYYYIDNFHLRTFRSVLPLLFAKELKINSQPFLTIGAASELVFYIALLQDDIIDNDDRRGKIKSSHIKYGVYRTIASADYCYAGVISILEDLCKTNLPVKLVKKILKGFKSAHISLYRSFLTEINTSLNLSINKEEVRRIHLDKTAQGINSLFCSGLVIENISNIKISNSIRLYSENLAHAGQIKNDLYDFIRYSKTRGFSDFKNGYVNYVLWKIMDLNILNQKALKKIFDNNDYEKIIKIINDNNFRKKLYQDIENLVNIAILEIQNIKLPVNLKDVLITWAEGNRKIS